MKLINLFISATVCASDPCQELCEADGPAICWDGSWVTQNDAGVPICANYFYTSTIYMFNVEYRVADSEELSLLVGDALSIRLTRTIYKNRESFARIDDFSFETVTSFFGTDSLDPEDLMFNGQYPSFERIIALRQFVLESASDFIDIHDGRPHAARFNYDRMPVIIADINGMDLTAHPGGPQAVLIPFLVLPDLFHDRRSIPREFWIDSGLAAFIDRHMQLIRKGIREGIQMIRHSFARNPVWNDDEPIHKYVRALGSIATLVLRHKRDIRDSADIFELITRLCGRSYKREVLKITINRDADFLDQSIDSLRSSRVALLRMGRVAIELTYMDPVEHHVSRQIWFRRVGDDINALNIFEYTTDHATIQANRNRYIATGLFIGMSLASQTAVGVRIPSEFWPIIHRDVTTRIAEVESSWEVIAEGLRKFIPSLLRKRFENLYGPMIGGLPRLISNRF